MSKVELNLKEKEDKVLNLKENDEKVLKQKGKRKKREPYDILKGGANEACQILIDMLSNDQATNALKVDCAKEILNRVFGKTFSSKEEEQTQVLSIAEELKKFME